MVGFDSISAELQYRSVRYWTVRMRRSSFFFGKFLGVYSLVVIMTVVMHFAAYAIAAFRGASFGDTFGWGIKLLLAILPIQLAWCGMAVFISSLARTPFMALLFNFAANFALWLIWIIGSVNKTDVLMYLYPNRWDVFLFSPSSDRVALGLLACAGFAAVFCAAGVFLFQRRDL
jgi:ABC-type transport system involved in multi-copper enzyme maturation permease subunit